MTMKTVACFVVLCGCLCSSGYGAEGFTTSPANRGELELLYTQAIERRAAAILDALDLDDSATLAKVHDVIVNQYRALRARDAVVDGYLRAQTGSDNPEAASKREGLAEEITEPLHKLYVDTLSAYLTPEQVEVVKDRMTYNKVTVTFDAYCQIIPGLTDSDKAMIMEMLKAAREEAIDGGSADEKHAIFDRYKTRVNAQLKANGHDVDKAFKEYEAKQGLAGSPDPSPETSAN
jgi:hypothetical protein